MQCLTQKELLDLYGPTGFSVVSNHAWHRNTLTLESKMAAQQKRIGGRPAVYVDQLAQFAEALNRWHPTNRQRLLWVDHWADDFPSTHALFLAPRAGLGETRSLSDAPGHRFDSFPYGERDQLKISPEQGRQTGLLIGLTSLMMMNGWDGWLLADGSADRIEFWEGNLFFHSVDKARLVEAELLTDEFNCPLNLT